MVRIIHSPSSNTSLKSHTSTCRLEFKKAENRIHHWSLSKVSRTLNPQPFLQMCSGYREPPKCQAILLRNSINPTPQIDVLSRNLKSASSIRAPHHIVRGQCRLNSKQQPSESLNLRIQVAQCRYFYNFLYPM